MLRILEISWLVIALLGAGMGVFKLTTDSISSAIWFFLFTLVATIFWLVRRKQRITMQKHRSARN
jgi:hypothetical protein